MNNKNDTRMHVVVVGASTGIGFHAVQHFLKAGYQVTAVSRSGIPEKFALDENLGWVSYESEIGIEDMVLSLKRRCREVGGLSGLVLNAGIIEVGPLSFVDRAGLMKMLDVNFLLHVDITRSLLPSLLKGCASIVYISSSAAKFASEGRSAYSASKSAAEAYFLTLGREFGKAGVRSNIVRPGLTDTALMNLSTSDDGLRLYKETSALGRVLKPEEIANTIEWLVSPKSSGVTCQTISVDGGARV